MSEGYIPLSMEYLSPRVQKYHRRIQEIIDREVIPLETELQEWSQNPETQFTPHPKLQQLRVKAREEDLWNFGYSKHTDPTGQIGKGLSNVEYAFLCEQMGRSIHWAPGVFNCGAPGVPNVEILLRYGSAEQKERWLKPLVEGEIKSCFAMTEPAVASSDANNICASIRREADQYVINGRKWFISGASDPICKLAFFMGKTDPDGPMHRQHSLVLVPMDTQGVKVIRNLTNFGFMDAPHGHAEIVFENVRVPVSNLLYEEGRGFEIGQGRLGPARVHHCMRILGAADRSIELMVNRAQTRVAFGKPLSSLSSIQQDIAKSRVELEQARLLVLKTAHVMDTQGNKVAAPYISMIKLAVPETARRIIDRAIQVHGGLGVCQETPLSWFYAEARAMCIYDGPTEVHCRAVAGQEMRRQAATSSRL